MAESTGPNEAMRKLLAGVWEKNLPTLLERVAHLESVITLAQAGALGSVQREEAIATAHKLAGSLGMFGYTEGTEAARAIEQRLDEDGAVDIAMLEANVSVLRSIVSAASA